MTLTQSDFERLTRELCSPGPNVPSRIAPHRDHDLEAMRSALACIPADVSRGDGTIFDPDGRAVDDYWFGVVLAARRYGGEAAKPLVREWSSSSARFTEEGFEHAWSQYDPDYPHPVTMRSVFRLAEVFGWRQPTNATRYKLLNRAAMLALKPIQWRVKGIFPREGIGAIFGPSGSGKSFLERFPHELNRRGFPWRLRCDSDFLLVAGGQHRWHARFHRIFGTGLSQRLMGA